MKDKNVAGILALFFGWAGVHRFYLGQPGLGVLYLFSWLTIITPFILCLVDAIVFFTMDDELFDIKYNKQHSNRQERGRHRNRNRNRNRQHQRSNGHSNSQQRPQYRPASQQNRNNPYRERGIQKYKDYDFKGAIDDFKKSLELKSEDKNVHFILACAYSLSEELQNSLFHLDKAVEQGFNDFEKLNTHDALAYLRTQPQFDNFVDNGYRIIKKIEAPKMEQERELDDLVLNKIQRLGELKDKGFITEDEFEAQKKKLLG